MSVKFKDLKAFVRYDGSGRVVAGSLVFRKKKPKNGRWSEISSNLCCNASGTTTTTTTQGGGGVTPTAWVITIYASSEDACNNIPFTTSIGYTANSTAGIATTIWADATLTVPFSTPNFYTTITLAGDSNIYSIATMQTTFITSIYTCPVYQESAICSFSPVDSCAGSGTSLTVYYSGTLGNGTQLYLDSNLTTAYLAGAYGDYVRLYFQAQDQVCTMNGNIIMSYTAC